MAIPVEKGQPLSRREAEIVELVIQGFSNKEISRAIGVTEKNVKFHLTRIYAKRGARSRAQLIVQQLTK